ncbi:TetR/AcrR family transcriptional regulator [Glaciihabitans sp. dw_435]|uniref:TetR/AcrR family transcriptional regulator n=1 Tax=Glaciihabitans sp. dw_435 TaxID=2720081 RepID=UPI001BD523C4|nr:TetR/AcrR family transcriptional regulator [Glaciihabitans sp. dw_435]
MAIDARVAQTRESLRQAIFRMAARMPMSELNVAELTREAGISRVTFYDHYKSPAQLLTESLTIELDEIRRLDVEARRESSASAETITKDSTLRIAQHVLGHRDLYEKSLSHRSSTTTLHHVLVAHISTSLEERFARTPPAEMPAGLSISTAASYTAHGIVGAIEVWLAGDDGDRASAEALSDSIGHMLPSWWR